MAQTISIQRGQTTVTGNGTSSATLFTNGSSGNATRVIINQLSFSITPYTQAYGVFYATMFLASSGAGTSTIGGMYNSSNGSPVISPMNTQSPPANSSMNTSTYSASTGVGLWSESLGAPNIISYPRPAGREGSNVVLGYFPTNFYIGPSDAIKISSQFYRASGKSGVAATVTVSYSFTLITES